MAKINFEDGTPLFSEQEMYDAISCVAMCITQAIKDGKYDYREWKDYLLRWNQTHHYPEESLNHMLICINNTIKCIKSNRHE